MNASVSDQHRLNALTRRIVQTMGQASAERTPEIMRELARQVVDLRSHFIWNDLPDWGGRSMEYRNAIYHAYRDAGVPSDSVAGLQANLRYHVGNVVREIAPPQELNAIGLDPEGPRARAVRARTTANSRRKAATRSPMPAPELVPLAVMRDPLALASFAIDAVRAIRALRPRAEMAEALQPLLKRLSEQTFDAVADTARSARR